MYSKRLLGLLFVALSVLSIAQAFIVDTGVARGLVHGGSGVVRRQLLDDLTKAGQSSDSSSDDSSSDDSSTEDDSSTSPAAKPTTSLTSVKETSVAPSTPTTSPPKTEQSETPTTSVKSTVAPPTTSSPPPATTSSPKETTSEDTNTEKDTTTAPPNTTPKTTPTLVKSTVTKTFTTTNANGQATEIISESTAVSTPSLAPQDGGNKTSGMSSQTRNTIIGVVVGVGGAIVLGVVGLFAWRIWGRKKAVEEPDNLVGTGYAPIEKTEPGAPASNNRSPFQSTLESYHAPSNVNASSNF